MIQAVDGENSFVQHETVPAAWEGDGSLECLMTGPPYRKDERPYFQ